MKTTVKIGGNTWTVDTDFSQSEINNIVVSEGEGNGDYYGLTLYNKPSIDICGELGTEVRRDTLYHEVVHALLGGIGFQEALSSLTSPQWVEVLCDNLGRALQNTDWKKLEEITKSFNAPKKIKAKKTLTPAEEVEKIRGTKKNAINT